MRTTVDLPDHVHRRASALARDRTQSLSRTLADLITAALDGDPPTAHTPGVELDPVSGFPVVRVGRPITTDDVRSLDDE